MPSHEDWLNDLSSTPPMSSTMQALIVLAPPPPPAEADDDCCVALDEVPPAGAELLLLPPLLLLPHADRVSATAATPAITALVRRPRTIVVPSRAGTTPAPALAYLRHGIGAGASRKGSGRARSHLVIGSLRR